MVKKAILLICIGLIGSWVMGQEDVFPLQTDPGKGWQVLDTKAFNGTGLWGYIDGGADIYMEYGFERVWVQYVMASDHLFKMETYCMRDSIAAFGIFSISRYQCVTSDSLGILHCISPYQIIAVAGNYYLSLSNQEGTSQSTQAGIQLLKSIEKRLPEGALRFPEPFTEKDAKGELKCMKGPLGLMNGYPALSELFEPYREFAIFVLPLPGTGIKPVLGRVDFTDRKDREELMVKLTELQNESENLIILQNRIDPMGLLFLMGSKREMNVLLPYIGLFEHK